MIWFWVIAGLITALAVALVLRPLMRRQGAQSDAAYDEAIYRDQLAEIERDQRRGLINAVEADNARTEISRRLLAASRRAGGDDGDPGETGAERTREQRQRRVLPAALVCLVPVGVLSVYLALGSPHIASQPLASRDQGERLALAERVEEAETLARELQRAPEDLDGWMTLGGLYGQLDRWSDAAAAYGRAVGLAEGAPGPTGAWAEALVYANQGTVTLEAEEALNQVLAARPGDPRARYYLALAEAQAGRLQAALEAWGDLAADTPPDASWRAPLEARIAETAEQAGLDAETYLARFPEAPRGPDADDLAAAAEMDAAERQAMVEGMVQSLADRLAEEPDDLDGWLRLANAYQVLERPEDALAAFDGAIAAAPDDPRGYRGWLQTALADWTVLDPMPEPAQERLDTLAEIAPEATDVLMLQAVRAESIDRPDDALAIYRRLIDQLPDESPARATIAQRIAALDEAGGGD
jgi:cytochrome c-type biogenesis protein CcmH